MSRTAAKRRPMVMAALALTVAGAFGAAAVPAANADGPGAGAPWVVSLGDSYISGEAGRWAGNTNQSSSKTDALGATAYYDNATGTGEEITRCHRSKSAEVFIGGGVNGKNLACSGAETATSNGSNFKPGIDFYDGAGGQGQAKQLQGWAAGHNVKMVSLSIGGNNFDFASVVQSCVLDFLTSPSWWKDYCNDDSSVKASFTAANVATQTAAIKGAIVNVRQAMSNAGYSTSQYKIVVQGYESPLPPSSGLRYSQSGYGRQSTGGCGFYDADLDWANSTALPTINGAVQNAVAQSGVSNATYLNLSSAFNGRRLCENTVGLLEERGLASWQSPGAVDNSEWVEQIRTASTVFGPYFVQESLHPNYWGELALRNCIRQAYNGGSPRGGTCVRSANGLNASGEPNMALN